MSIIKIVLLALAGCMLALIFQKEHKEYVTYLCIGVGVLILHYSVERLQVLLGEFGAITELIPEGKGYMAILLKSIGITYLCETCAGICRDSGFGQVAVQIEIFGKLSILILGIPVVSTLIELISGAF